MRSLILILIRCYQCVLRPLLGSNGPTCRFFPTCSCYAHEAIQRHGAWRGSRMTIARLARCHPWNEGGYDPVQPVSCDTQPCAHTTSTSRFN